MTPKRSQITVCNNTQRPLQIGLEPEGDCVTVPVGAKCLVRGQDADADFELEIEDGLLSVHLDSIKEVEVDGVRVR